MTLTSARRDQTASQGSKHTSEATSSQLKQWIDFDVGRERRVRVNDIGQYTPRAWSR